MDETLLNLDTGMFSTKIGDHVKFGKIKNFDLRRGMVMANKEAMIYPGGKSWGAATRKETHATCSIRAGSGKLSVNKKPMVDYFLMPR
jgi:hypothetical protein